MNSVSIKAALAGLFALLTLMIGGLGYVAITKIAHVNDNVVAFSTRWFLARDLIGGINVNIPRARALEAQHMLSSSTEEMAGLEKQISDIDEQVSAGVSELQALETDESQKRIIDALQKKWLSYNKLRAPFLEISRKSGDNTTESGKFYKGEMQKLSQEMIAAGDSLRSKIVEGAKNETIKAAQEYEDTRSLVLIAGGIGLVLAFGAMAFGYLGISAPMEQLTRSMEALAKGNLSTDVPFADRGNEIGAMAGAVQVFKSNMMRARELETDAEAAKTRADADRKRAMTDLADRFERTVGAIVTTVSDAAAELQAAAQALSSSSSQTTHQSTVVAAASEQAAANVRTVAAAAEQLSGSVREISRQVSMSSTIARKAVEEAQQTNEQVSGLSVGAQKIGAIVDLINDIASKTNLLALNATIEAARAGEAGRGFAVVAQEVKALAEQTGKATAEITSHIASVQTSTDQAASAILGIGKTIDEINQIAAGIAAAVEEQGAATEEIARNVDQAAHGTTEVTRNISGVNQAAESSSASASQVLSAATELSSQSDKLRAEMQRFLSTVRAA